MTATETATYLENLMLSHAISDALNAKIAIVLSRSNGYWVATISGGHRLETIILPYADTIPYGMVAWQLANTYPSPSIVVRLD